MDSEHKNLAKILKALADKNRLKIIDLLSCGPMCVCNFTENLDLSQPNVSHHLKILKNAGLITSKRRGRWIDYQLNQSKIDSLQQEMGNLLAKCEKEDCELLKTDCGEKKKD